MRLILNRCPEFKGIETGSAAMQPALLSLNRCPEFKGIETYCIAVIVMLPALNRCPEFKGIETGYDWPPEWRGIESMP